MSRGFKLMTMAIHVKCVGNNYSTSKVRRQPVPANFIPWDVEWSDYDPPVYNSNILLKKPWADPEIGCEGFQAKFNLVDDKINRISFAGKYRIEDGYPINPVGRTGIVGRGVLGRWGPNHAADPVVTRWKRTDTGNIVINDNDKKPMLEICVIERHDCGEWALPGGMVDPGETVADTSKREFMEEALNSQQRDKVDELFADGRAIYTGYVDDPRNTDNAWMETSAFHYHDNTGNGIGAVKLCAGDDAKNAKWTTVDSKLKLYASHGTMVKEAVNFLNAHW